MSLVNPIRFMTTLHQTNINVVFYEEFTEQSKAKAHRLPVAKETKQAHCITFPTLNIPLSSLILIFPFTSAQLWFNVYPGQ